MEKFWRFENKTITNATGESTESTELRIDGDIVSENSAWFHEWLGIPVASKNTFRRELEAHKGKDITVWIDSNGGDVFAAASIYNALKEHDGKVTVKIDSKAMSAASVIAMAGDEIHMSPVALMMIHNPLTSAKGDMHDMRKVAEVLDTVKETIINAYAAKTGKPRAKISAMMDDETWMSASVAVKEGFADSVISHSEPVAIANDFSFNKFAIVNSTSKAIEDLVQYEDESNKEQHKIQAKLRLLKLGGNHE